MYLQQLKETSGVEITHWFENTFFISNNVTKRGIIDVGDGGKVERVSLEYFPIILERSKLLNGYRIPIVKLRSISPSISQW